MTISRTSRPERFLAVVFGLLCALRMHVQDFELLHEKGAIEVPAQLDAAFASPVAGDELRERWRLL